MSNLNDTLRKIKSEDLLSRFRSKEDLYKYLKQQSNFQIKITYTNIVGLFLPSYKGTKLSFIRAILSNSKKAIRQQDIISFNVPQYQEISVLNLYQDAIQDPELQPYLPDLNMNSNRFPERKFFFGILGTIKPDYLRKIIYDANIKRYSIEDNKQENDYIVIDDNWYQELIKHPFLSRKPGKAIHLIKQRSKLIRNKKVIHKFDLSQRISQQNIENEMEEEFKMNFGTFNKRQKTQSFESQSLISQGESNKGMKFNI